MKLIYNGLDLATLGVLQIMGLATQREGEAPQRERQTLRVRLEVFERTFADNAGVLAELRAALKTQQAQLLWQDVNGTSYVNRTVCAGEDEEPADGRRVSGGTMQTIHIVFHWWNHDVATNCLAGSWQRAGGPAVDLGAVTDWREGLVAEYFDRLRDHVKYEGGTVTAAGRWQGDTTQPVAARRSALLAIKDRLLTELQTNARGQVVYGTFNQAVRVESFTAEIDQALNAIGWKLTGRFTRWPNEADYSLVEYKVTTTVAASEGITRVAVSGSIGAPTEALARARLALLKAALQPAGYVQEEDRRSAATAGSKSGLIDYGLTFTELTFDWAFRDLTTIGFSFQRKGSGTPVVDLGVVEKFGDGYDAQLWDEMRDNRRRSSGLVNASGHWWVADTVSRVGSPSPAQVQLETQLTALETELAKGVSGLLTYGSVLNQNVRLTHFLPEIDREQNRIGWTLTATYTRWPDEADYALCEFATSDHEDKVAGTVVRKFKGKIGAPNQDYALEKLTRLRASLIDGTQYVAVSSDIRPRWVQTESGHNSAGGDTGEGQTFLELEWDEEWRKTQGGVVQYHLRVDTATDDKAGYQRVTYAGAVQATGATIAAAFAVASGQAATLGAGKYPMPVRSDLAQNQELFLTSGGKVFVTVDFTYEYQLKGARVYLEVGSTLEQNTFGQDTEQVQGYVMAPTLAAAQAVYQQSVRSLAQYAGALVRNERTPTLQQETLMDVGGGNPATQDGRYTFGFAVHRPKVGATRTALQYSVVTTTDVQANLKLTTVRGRAFAADATTAGAAITATTGGLGLGVLTRSDRTPEYEQGASLAGGTVGAFLSLEFADSYELTLTGGATLLETEVTEEAVYSGTRIVEMPLPAGPSVLQNCGTTCGQHKFTARAVASNEAAALAYVKGVRAALLLGTGLESPPQVRTEWTFQKQVAGTPRGGSANPRVCTVTGSFGEMIANLPFAP